MLVVLLSWIYIALVCMVIGAGVLGCVKKNTFSLTHYVMTGIVAITVYVEFFSIFAKIGALAHGIMLAAALFIGYFRRKEIGRLFKTYRVILCSWEGFFYGCFILFIAFCSSRGEFHTDTNIYHAASIRLYEEYGVLKGAGNLQLHYAYNSAYLAFASIFSLNWLFGRSLHTTTGLLEVIMCLYAFHGLKDFERHESHMADMMRVGILFYALVNVTRSMSPATDYAVMFFVFFIMTAWCDNIEQENKGAESFSLLAVMAVFTATLKFSACLLVLLAIYPASILLKEKRWRETALCILCGCLILLPFFIRNYLISGWLLYPFDSIDIFRPEWKIPEEYLLVDAGQIEAWGKCLYDIEKIDLPVTEWFPIWWEHQFRYEQMFLLGVVLAAILQMVLLFVRLIRRQPPCFPLVVLHFVIWGNLAVWFFMAPFIRYGLAFLFAVIMLAVGECISRKREGFISIVTGGLLFCILVSVSPYWDQYITDAGVFVKHSLREPYYIWQKDYDVGNMESREIHGNLIYYSAGDEVNSYHVWPGTCYEGMLERSTLIGDKIEDGFRAK